MKLFGWLLAGAAALAPFAWSFSVRAEEAPQEVRVRAERRSPSRAPKDPTIAATVIEREELSAPGVRLPEVLRGQAGVQVTESGGAGAPATASIRGATPAQLPVYLAGVRLNDDVAGTADLSRIPLWLVQRLEIYRGNAPPEADRLGIAGALFFEPRWPRGRELGAGGTLGSYGTRQLWTYGSVGDRDAAVLVGVSAEAATNDYTFVNDHGTLLAPTGSTVATMSNADVATYDAWILARSRAGGGVVDALGNVTTREQGVPTLALVPSRRARASFTRGIGAVQASLPAGDRMMLELSTSASFARTVVSDPLDELALAARRVDIVGARLAQRVALRVQPTASLALRGAIDVWSESLGRDDDDAPALRARRLGSRVALGARQWIGDSFSIQPLVSGACNGTSTRGVSACDTFEPSGRVGVAWTRPTWDVFADASRYVRVPTLGELYGVSVLVRGNPTLRSESAIGAEAGARWNGPRRTDTRGQWASLVGFVRWSNALIVFARSAQGFAVPINVDEARVAGIEAQAGADVLRWLDADVSVTLLDPRNTTPGRRTVNDVLPFQSRLVVAPRVAAHTRLGLRWVDRVRAEVRWIYQSSRYADPAGLAVIPDQSSLDAELLAQTRDEVLTARLRCADLLDAQRVDIVGFPLPRRSVFFSLEAKW